MLFSDIHVGVDGTGVASNEQYAREFSQSFTKLFGDCNAWDAKAYRRGPTTLGNETDDLARWAFMYASDAYQLAARNPRMTPRIFLTGYSRGGAAVIHACKLLKKKNIPVHALFLFDAVDRSASIPFAWSVPSNIANVFHARRSSAAFSRISFGNCGTSRDDKKKTKYAEEFFMCTHGAMGGLYYKTPQGKKPSDRVMEPDTGLPWTNVTFAQDKLGAQAVDVWMRRHLEQMRVRR